MTLIYLGGAWILGILFGAGFAPFWGIVLSGLVLSLALGLLGRRRKALLVAGICGLAFFGAMLRFQASLPETGEQALSFYNGVGEVVVWGVVDKEPELEDNFIRLRLSAAEVQVGGKRREVSGRLLLRLARFPAYRYGDGLRVAGGLVVPWTQEDGFDTRHYYRDRLARQGVLSAMDFPRVERVAVGQGSPVVGSLSSLRHRLSRSLAQALPEPQGSLAQGILLGLRGNIPRTLKATFVQTGTAHLLAISGLHVAIVAGLLLGLGIWALGRERPYYILLPLLALWLYIILSGMRPPAIRAGVMMSLFLAAEYLGRQRSTPTALVFAAAAMVGIHPHILWDVGFQLSFLALAGLIFLAPFFRFLGRSAALSLSAVLATWPLIAHHFGIVSAVSLPATLLALAALPAVILGSALVAFLGLVSDTLAWGAGLLVWPFLSYMIEVVKGFASLPGAYVAVGSFGAPLVWGYYLGLGAVLGTIHQRRRLTDLASRLRARPPGLPRRGILTVLLLGAIGVWVVALVSPPPGRLEVSFLDVGQGDAILIQTPSHLQVLVDGGPSPRAIALALGRELPFWDRSLDLLVLTHPEADHLGGLVEVLGRYRVGRVMGPGLPADSSLYREWRRLLDEKGIPYFTARTGQRVELGDGIVLEVLGPSEAIMGRADLGPNDKGVVLRLVKGGVSFLLMGDVGWEGEMDLLSRRAGLRSTVFKVGHHGSKTSTSPQSLMAVGPQAAVISVGAENTFGHPSPEVVGRLEERLGEDRIFLTSEQGTITLSTDGVELWVKTER
ncbi:MAG: DNA internalization-related competence protein ComEC/Rec2 [Dehalococcoidia bacterium]